MADTGFKTANSLVSNTWGVMSIVRIGASDNSRAQAAGTTFLVAVVDSHAFGLPTGAIIDGIEVRAEFLSSIGTATATIQLSLSQDGGSNWTATKSDTTTSTTDVTKTYGGAADLWGASWSKASFDDGYFSLKIEGKSSNAAQSCNLDYCAVKVYYSTQNPAVFFLLLDP